MAARSSPEFATLLIGLTTYTAAFIAEIVRAGILSVPRGQLEAARSLGLGRRDALRYVTLPQALRLVVPPLTSQYLNLTKNSSLAVAIGYPDLVSIANTTMNQTGQAIEGVATIMAVFLTVSLSISAFMNLYKPARCTARHRRMKWLPQWIRQNLFSNWWSALVTLAILWLAFRYLSPFLQWAFVDAVWTAPDPRACRQAEGRGACWGVHRREAPLHPVRHLSLRAALATGAGDGGLDPAVDILVA